MGYLLYSALFILDLFEHDIKNFIFKIADMLCSLGSLIHWIAGKLKSSIEEKLNSPKDKYEEEKDISAVDRVKQKYRYTTNDVSIVNIPDIYFV